MPRKTPPFERLLSGYKTDEKTGCWLWVGSKYKNGYGWLKVFGKSVSTHRYSYEIHNGYIPKGMEVMHSCDVRNCINPDHLSLGTHAENMRQASERGRMPCGEKHHTFGKTNPRPNQANKVMVLGVEYESQNSAERALGLGSGTVRYWLKNTPHKAKLLNNLNKKEK
jgi:hypothetical protein